MNIIKIKEMSKVYKIYDNHIDRLKEALNPNKKIYSREHYALHNVNIKINKGESIGILGTNGSGKSTLLKIITGVLNPSSGSVEVNGKVSALLELGAGFNPEYTGIENVYLNGSMMGYSKEEMDTRIEPIKEFADIGEFLFQPVKTYSSGMFARLAFAVAINVEPEILIVDEALSVGDARFQIKCIEKMKEIKNNGTTILFVSHSIEQVRRFCDRAIWIDKGVIKDDGDVNEVANQYDNFLIYGNPNLDLSKNGDTELELNEDENEAFILPEDSTVLGKIIDVTVNSTKLKTFDKLDVIVTYDIFVDNIPNYLIGVAIYTPDREYIFGPNTHLDRVLVPDKLGRHKVKYSIPKIPLLSGLYNLDVGLFSQEGLVCIDYKNDVKQFSIDSDYISEGRYHINHEWEIL